jgi:hypothetical protein
MLSFLIEKKRMKKVVDCWCFLILIHICMRRLWPCCAGCLFSFAHHQTPFENYELDLFWPCYLQADSFNHIIWKATHTHTERSLSLRHNTKKTRPKKNVKCIAYQRTDTIIDISLYLFIFSIQWSSIWISFKKIYISGANLCGSWHAWLLKMHHRCHPKLLHST